MPVADAGRIQRELFTATSADWEDGLAIYSRWRGYTAAGYNGIYKRAFDRLVRLGYLDDDTVIGRHGGHSQVLYRRLKDVYYYTERNPRYQYAVWPDLDGRSRAAAELFYSGLYEWLDMDDFVYPTAKPCKLNGFTSPLIKSERVLAITVKEAEERRAEWIRQRTDGMSEVLK